MNGLPIALKLNEISITDLDLLYVIDCPQLFLSKQMFPVRTQIWPDVDPHGASPDFCISMRSSPPLV